MRFILSLLFVGAILFQPLGISAFETDQYNLPPEPLVDIGNEVSEHVEQNLRKAIGEVNAEIAEHEACVTDMIKPKSCGSSGDEVKKLAFLRSDRAVADAVFKLLGDGNLFIAKTGKWFREQKFNGSPDRYKVSYGDSIYVFMPLDYATLSPTVKLYGSEFGTDKIDHFFQQGHKYYTIRDSGLKKRKTAVEAEKKAVKWGQRTERTYFGLLVSGVYSNADLFANYVGMKFYQGLTEPVTVGESIRPAIFKLENGFWQINENVDLRDSLIKPFLTDHLNEALNPSGYAFNVYPTVRRVVRDHACPEWRKLMPNATKADLEKRSTSLETWYGEDYGFTKKSKTVSIADSCFPASDKL
ncbi:MAG: hypothetical protein WBO10_06615 [Pyrinomonadaceae bacterium]